MTPARKIWVGQTPVDQLGYVVDDLDAAMAYWTSVLGAGPFFCSRRTTPRPVRFRGRDIQIHNSTALGFAGGTQIELIEQHCSTPSAYREFLDVQGPGLHHIARFSVGYDEDVAAAEAAGMTYIMGGSAGTDIRYSYWQHAWTPTGAPLLELVSRGHDLDAMIEQQREAAREWDGCTDPVRASTSLPSRAG